jgi:hypothetical protein
VPRRFSLRYGRIHLPENIAAQVRSDIKAG